MKEQGILPIPQKKNATNSIDENTVKKVIQFYENANNSHLLPDRKDCVSIFHEKIVFHYTIKKMV